MTDGPMNGYDSLVLEAGYYVFAEPLFFDVDGRWKDVVRAAFRANSDQLNGRGHALF